MSGWGPSELIRQRAIWARLGALAAVLAFAGCAGGGLEGMIPRGPALLEPAPVADYDLIGEGAFSEMPLHEAAWASRALGQGWGAGVAVLVPYDDDDREWLEDGYYLHVRYLYELGLLLAWEFDTGIYKAENKLAGVVPGQKDVEALPIRLTLQVHTDITEINVQMYLLAGGGYYIYDDDGAEDEWGFHYGLGAEFGGLASRIGTRVEAGHVRLLNSGINQWTGSLAVYYKF